MDSVNNNEYLKAGDIVLSWNSMNITTVLGSCVSVWMWDSRKLLGGACHYKIPQSNGRLYDLNFYGEHAIDNLLSEMLKHGCSKRSLETHVYGGGVVIAHMDEFDIGGLNARFAVQRLAELGLRVVHMDTGGDFGRKLIFSGLDGTVRVERVRPLHEFAKPAIPKSRKLK